MLDAVSRFDKYLNNAIADGIKAVGVGKQGSTHCTTEQVESIIRDYHNGQIHPIQWGAFFGALWTIGVAHSEEGLNEVFPSEIRQTTSGPCILNPEVGIPFILRESPIEVQNLARKIIRNEVLSVEDSELLAQYLFPVDQSQSHLAGLKDVVGKAFITSALRVRYTDPQEYVALHRQIQKTIHEPFYSVRLNKPILQMAEPFDGVERSHLLTPILARHFAKKNYEVIVQTGRSSGPKFGLTLLSIAKELGMRFLNGSSDLEKKSESLLQESYVDQKTLSTSLDQWVDIRRLLMKRPFLATLEKYVDPFGLDIFMASAFHHSFTDKMVEIAEQIGYRKIIICFRGVEGSLGLSLGRTAQITCSVRQAGGEYLRKNFEASPEVYGFEKQVDRKLSDDELQQNAGLIRQYLSDGQSQNEYFNQRVRYSLQVYDQALDWVTKA